jgi:hypothetical protein
MMSSIRFLTMALGLAGLALPAATLSAQAIAPGAIVTAKANVLMYRTPPEGAFYKKGEVVDTARSGERLRVLESKEVKTLSKRDLWLNVQPLNSNENDRNNRPSGWVYAGPVGGESNFEVIAEQRSP